MATICPKCGASDTLRQKVELHPDAVREVTVVLRGAPEPAVEFGKPAANPDDLFVGRDNVVVEHDIECTACGETWDDKKDLIEGHPREYECDSCDWWGANEFQHGLERPGCSGVLSLKGASVA